MSQAPADDALFALLEQRRSTPSRLLRAPGPDAGQRQRILQAAMRVPDHGKLAPWRIVEIAETARERLGQALVARRREIEPDVAPAQLDKDRERFQPAPWALAVVAQLVDDGRIPQQEQLLSGACVCFSLLLAAEALGFGAQWLTGWAAYDANIAAMLGLAANERILGFVHIGSADERAPERLRPAVADKFSRWTGE